MTNRKCRGQEEWVGLYERQKRGWEDFVQVEPRCQGKRTGEHVGAGWGVHCMNSPHNSTLCLDLQTEKPRTGLGMQPTLEYPKSPGPG